MKHILVHHNESIPRAIADLFPDIGVEINSFIPQRGISIFSAFLRFYFVILFYNNNKICSHTLVCFRSLYLIFPLLFMVSIFFSFLFSLCSCCCLFSPFFPPFFFFFFLFLSFFSPFFLFIFGKCLELEPDAGALRKFKKK
jgi:hypothetical protein